uniref:Interferon regulatory factor-3 domain-containing protein n=1 Tax=Zonotrichia albicollis TaxID=44394 RepID=A0A8D2M9A3_ZONAL
MWILCPSVPRPFSQNVAPQLAQREGTGGAWASHCHKGVAGRLRKERKACQWGSLAHPTWPHVPSAPRGCALSSHPLGKPSTGLSATHYSFGDFAAPVRLLPHLERGVLLWVAPEGVFMKRQCQGRVYWNGPLAPHRNWPNKLERERTYKLLDTQQYIQQVREYLSNGQLLPQYQIYLCFGEEYPTRAGHPFQKLIMAHVSSHWGRPCSAIPHSPVPLEPPATFSMSSNSSASPELGGRGEHSCHKVSEWEALSPMAPFQLCVARQSAQGAQCAGPDKDRC